MNPRILMLVLLAAPVVAPAQQPSTSPASSIVTAPAKSHAAPAQSPFRVSNPDVQRVLRETAVASEASTPAADASARADANPPEGFGPLRFRAPRRVDRMKCDGDRCVALTADGTELYTVTEDGRVPYDTWSTGDHYDAWLSCQSSNNLLTTFERFDKCRGISIGIPAVSSNLGFALPRIGTR
jgi:hypothetical protein